jgi:hypothetical protein
VMTTVGAPTASAAERLAYDSVDASSGITGHYAQNATDHDLATSWAACGDGQWLAFDLGKAETVTGVRIAFAHSRTRRYRFRVQVTSDVTRTTWTTALVARSTNAVGLQRFVFPARQAGRYVRIVGYGNSSSTVGCLVSLAEVVPLGSPNFSANFETHTAAQFSDLECATPSRQFRVVRNHVRGGHYAARFEERPGDVWSGNGTVRCLAVQGQTNESQGDDYYYAMSFFFPRPITPNLLWETHARSSIYSLSDPLSVAPNAIVATGASSSYSTLATTLSYRLDTGQAIWSGTDWSGWSDSELMPIVSPIPVGIWIDVVVHVRFAFDNTGTVEVWERKLGHRWPLSPQVERIDVPTMQYVPGGLDPNVPTARQSDTLYDSIGLYKGSDLASRSDVVYIDSYGIYNRLAKAEHR